MSLHAAHTRLGAWLKCCRMLLAAGLSSGVSAFHGQRLPVAQRPALVPCTPRRVFGAEAAHKQGAGSTKNGRDSVSKRRGVKVYGGQPVKAGGIIVRQLGTKACVLPPLLRKQSFALGVCIRHLP